MRSIGVRRLTLALCALFAASALAAQPFKGTIFLEPDVIKETDPTAFVRLRATGQGMRQMFHRQLGWVHLNAFLFVAEYDDGLQIEIQVSPDFGSVAAAKAQADFYAPVFGRLPRVLRQDVKTSWIHPGDLPFGGGNDNLLIHTGSVAQDYIDRGILEEALVHEAAHTSLDSHFAASAAWTAAQLADGRFLSDYARDNPQREDMAETVLPYLAQRYRAHRISSSNLQIFRSTVPARNAYFDLVLRDLYPFEVQPPGSGRFRLSTVFRGPDLRLEVIRSGELANQTRLTSGGSESWKLTPRADGWYQITSRSQGDQRCLDIFNGGRFNNAPHLTGCANLSGQRWKLVAAGPSRYRLVTLFRGDGMCLDIHNGGPFDNMPHLVPCAGLSGQLWVLTPE